MAGRFPIALLFLALATIPQASCSDGGSSSDALGDGSDASSVPLVAVNEVVAKAPAAGPDWVELFNPGEQAVDLSGYVLRDALEAHAFTFPAGTSIAAGGFLVVEGQGGTSAYVTTFGFGTSDAARLFDAAGHLVDSTEWTKSQAPEGMSWGRYPDGTGEFATLSVPTQDAANASPL